MNKYKVALLALTTALIGLLPVTTIMAAADVRIESSLNVANVTAGNTQYVKSVDAKVDEVVKIQLYYHNMEQEDSGKIAKNVKAKISIPTAPGKAQVVSSQVGGDNTNVVNDTANINLSLPNARLEYVPGSAVWRHNIGTNTAVNYVNTPISDDVTKGGVTLGDEKPCFNFESYVTVLVRVKADAVSIDKQVRVLGEKTWTTENTAKAGDTVEYLITFKNQGNTTLNNVAVGDNMPAFVTYVSGSTMLKNGANPNGIKLNSDNITKGGIDVGNYTPGAVGYVWFQAKINDKLECGENVFKNVGLVRPEGMNAFYNTAITKVNMVCDKTTPTPTPTTTPTTTPQPQTPVLPEAGAEGLAGLAGLGTLGYATTAYLRSKKSLIAALKQ